MGKLGHLLLLFSALLNSGNCIPDGLAPTPPMGWSSWNTFFAENDEEKMRGIADAVVDLGLDQLGYVYLTVDDYWNLPERDADGNMQTNTTRFPSGMKALGEYIHSLGLKYGIYSDAGYLTCGRMAGSLGHEEQDLQLFLDFEIDYLKYDNCYPNNTEQSNTIDFLASAQNLPSFYQDPPEEERFTPMTDAVKAVKDQRDIIVELCLYGWGNVEEWGPDAGHLWRTGSDAFDNWESVIRSVDRTNEPRFQGRQGPDLGAWNYPDAVFTGNGGMTNEEYKTMFALWCAVKSPLMLGSDLRTWTVGDENHQIVTNENLIAINQDPLGIQATCVKDCCGDGTLGAIIPDVTCIYFTDSWQVWQGPLDNGDFVLVVVNRYDTPFDITMDYSADGLIPDGTYDVVDLWTGQNASDGSPVTVPGAVFSGTLDTHANWALRLTPVSV